MVHRAQQWPDKPLKTDGSAQPNPIPQDLALLHVYRAPLPEPGWCDPLANLSGWVIRSKSIFVTSLHLRCSLGRRIRSLRSQVLLRALLCNPFIDGCLQLALPNETCQGGYCDFRLCRWPRCSISRGHSKWRRTPAPEELLTQPKLLSDWAVQAGLLDRGIEVTEGDLEAAIALREAIYRTVTARLEGRRPKPADVELLNEHGSHAQLTPRLDRTGAVRREGTTSQLLARLAADVLDLLAGPDIEKVKGCAIRDLQPPGTAGLRRAHKIGIGAGWEPAATRPKCERSGSVSGPPNRGSPASAGAGRRGSRLP